MGLALILALASHFAMSICFHALGSGCVVSMKYSLCSKIATAMSLALSLAVFSSAAKSAELKVSDEGAVALGAETTASIAPGSAKLGASGLPLPRFASLKSANINVRVGPSKENAILWNYVKAGLPVEIVLEFDTWRKIRDSEGVEGWVSQAMLSGRRTATVEPGFAKKTGDITSIIEADTSQPELTVPLFTKPDDKSRRIALLEPGVNVDVITCDAEWCSVTAGAYGGWIEKTRIWGVYASETIDD
ncbi:MAG: SH3 domain-containing protein [Notoacmeibacter sp.]